MDIFKGLFGGRPGATPVSSVEDAGNYLSSIFTRFIASRDGAKLVEHVELTFSLH